MNKALKRGLGRFFRWAGITLAREAIEIATKDKAPTVSISPAANVALDVQFREQMITQPEAVREEIRRQRGMQL